MLKKIMALATTTAMLGANAAAYALNTARAAVRTVTGATAAGDEAKSGPVDGKSILPTIAPMPKDTPIKAVTRTSAATHKPSGHNANRVKPRIRKKSARKRGK